MMDDGALLPCAEFREILVWAYKCTNFRPGGPCEKLCWHPAGGWVPSGFLGAVCRPTDVKLWIVLWEPSGPETDQKNGVLREDMPPQEMFERVASISFHHYKEKYKPHHANVRHLLERCFRDRHPLFEDQLRLTWVCNSVLCSLPPGKKEFPEGVEEACVSRYLSKMKELIPQAYVVPMGVKDTARRRLEKAGIPPDFKGKAHLPGSRGMKYEGSLRDAGLESYELVAKDFRKHMRWTDW